MHMHTHIQCGFMNGLMFLICRACNLGQYFAGGGLWTVGVKADGAHDAGTAIVFSNMLHTFHRYLTSWVHD